MGSPAAEPTPVGNGDQDGRGQAQDGREFLGVDNLLHLAVDEPELFRLVSQPVLDAGKWAGEADEDDP